MKENQLVIREMQQARVDALVTDKNKVSREARWCYKGKQQKKMKMMEEGECAIIHNYSHKEKQRMGEVKEVLGEVRSAKIEEKSEQKCRKKRYI